MLRAAVPHGATAGVLLELTDGALHLVAGRPRTLLQPDLLDVGTLASFELGNSLLVCCHANLQHATRMQHVGHSTRAPLAKHCSTEGGLKVLWCHARFHQRHQSSLRVGDRLRGDGTPAKWSELVLGISEPGEEFPSPDHTCYVFPKREEP